MEFRGVSVFFHLFRMQTSDYPTLRLLSTAKTGSPFFNPG
jgi:hypothetical protein